MKAVNSYLKEIVFLRNYIVLIIIAIALSFSVYLFLSPDRISYLGKEDSLFEWLTDVFFVSASITCFINFLKTRNYYFLFFAIILFIATGEEVSWGQRLIGYPTPAAISKLNVQNEFNLHNLEIFNTLKFDQTHKEGFSRLLEINFIYRVSLVLIGIVLPFCAFHSKIVSRITRKLNLPIPPISLGIFFLISWMTYKLLLLFILPAGMGTEYYETLTEIFECLSAFVILMISFFFLNKRSTNIIGVDVKDTLT